MLRKKAKALVHVALSKTQETGTKARNGARNEQKMGTGPIVFGTAVATMCFVFARTGFRRKVAAAIVNFDR